ncbi:MAG TPA: GspE/PulE family protein, partial [Longimicrobiales bacterium]|nr:GspE/PulE family protein [Longimicrobiales bacterium]
MLLPKPTAAAPRVLGRLLVSSGAISEIQLATALHEQRQTRERLGEILIRHGADPEQIARALAAQLRLPYAEPPLRPEPAALRLVSRTLAERLCAVPLCVEEKSVQVALADPLNLAAIDDLEFQTGRRVATLVATAHSVTAALKAYDAEAVGRLVQRLPTAASRQEPDVDALQRASEAPPIVALVEHLLQQAVGLGASDVHVEPTEHGLHVRVRIDGILTSIAALPAEAAPAVVSRLKVLGGLDISVKRRPQDGRASLRVGERTYALRVSTLPAQTGEKVVLRILDPAAVVVPLEQLGLSDAGAASVLRMIGAPHGLLLVTGPTGSGKTTTLYAALGTIDRARRNVITLEDPVEYRLNGATQVQVHRRAGLSFASALRAVLRQDPDVIMVGELRDKETAEVALAAAATGHLVLSTLHTNDAPGAIARLFHLGVQPFMVAAALVGVIAQRLARRLCGSCRGAGCGRCRQGYSGRTGIFEILEITPPVRSLIARRAPVAYLRDAARAAGFTSLGEDAWRVVQAGLTSEAEVRPLLQQLEAEFERCPTCARPVRESFGTCPQCG